MPPVRVIPEEEATSLLGQMGYRCSLEDDRRLFYRHTERRNALVVLDFADGPIPYFVLFPALASQGVDTDTFRALLSGAGGISP